jgi:hypothetical protein
MTELRNQLEEIQAEMKGLLNTKGKKLIREKGVKLLRELIWVLAQGLSTESKDIVSNIIRLYRINTK